MRDDTPTPRPRARRVRPYYHASPIEMEAGTILTPGSARGQQTFMRGANDYVFLTRDEGNAAEWASTIRATINVWTVHIYEAVPLGPVRYRFVVDEPGRYEWYTTSARIVCKVETVGADSL